MNSTDPRQGSTSASNAQADLLCSGRHQAQLGIPEPPPSEDAESGRKIHAALADPENKEKLEALDDEELGIHTKCQLMASKMIAQFFPGITPKLFREERFWVTFKGPQGEQFRHSGQPDLVARHGLKALVIEFKTGRNEVPSAPENLQLRDQAVLVRGNLMLNEVATAVVQPWIGEPKACIYSQADLDRSALEMQERVVTSNSPGAKRVAGEEQCQYCRAKGKCPEYQKWAGAVVPVPRNVVDLPMAQWTLAERTIAADHLERAQQWLDLVKDQLKEWLRKDPEAVPGWALKDGSIRETISDPQKVFERFTNLGGKLEQYMETVQIGKTKLKAKLKEVTGLKGRALDKKLDDLIDGLVTTTHNSPSLTKKTKDKK